MATLSNEHSSLTPTTQRKAAPWGYFFYCEVLKIFRDPPSVIFGVGFPTVIFLIIVFWLPSSLSSTILASMAAYGAFVVALTTFSISLATKRSLGWNKLLRTTSMSSALYLGSKLLVILVTVTLSMSLLVVMSFASGIFIPMQYLPDFFQKIAPYLPTYI